MKKLLLAAVAVLALAGSAYAQDGSPADDLIGCGACSVKNPAVFMGWMKTSDIGCEAVDDCHAIDHYTDNYQRGEHCGGAGYTVPLYDDPHGKPIGLVGNEQDLLLGGKSKDGKYTRVWRAPFDKGGIYPYSPKALHECG